MVSYHFTMAGKVFPALADYLLLPFLCVCEVLIEFMSYHSPNLSQIMGWLCLLL